MGIQTRRLLKQWELLAIFLTAFAFFVVFRYGPMYGVLIAFKDFRAVDGIWGSPWVGFKHFAALFADGNFYHILTNTLVLNLLLILFAFPAPIVLALLLNEVRHP